MTPGQLQHRLQLGVLGQSQSRRRAEFFWVEFQQAAQAAVLLEQVAGEIHRAAARYPDP